MKKLVISLLLSLLLIASTNSYSFAENEGCRHSPKIEQKAKELGITVDELKAQRKAEHQAKLEKKAKELGISVDELKAKIKAKHCD
jgi:ribosomal protein L32E